jgi:hypothetical protein
VSRKALSLVAVRGLDWTALVSGHVFSAGQVTERLLDRRPFGDMQGVNVVKIRVDGI